MILLIRVLECLVNVCAVYSISFCFFFFQAEDGIRDLIVTGVQTCALPISGGTMSVRQPTIFHELVPGVGGAIPSSGSFPDRTIVEAKLLEDALQPFLGEEIGRASCRERV